MGQPSKEPKFVSRKYIHQRMREATGARIHPSVVDAVIDELHERFEHHLERLAVAHQKERELRIYHAMHQYQPMLKAHHLNS